MPSGQTFTIGVHTIYYDYVWDSIRYVGNKLPNCDDGNCITSCDIQITDAKQSMHKGIWTCTSYVKVDYGKYVDNIAISFDSEYSKSPNYAITSFF